MYSYSHVTNIVDLLKMLCYTTAAATIICNDIILLWCCNNFNIIADNIKLWKTSYLSYLFVYFCGGVFVNEEPGMPFMLPIPHRCSGTRWGEEEKARPRHGLRGKQRTPSFSLSLYI